MPLPSSAAVLSRTARSIDQRAPNSVDKQQQNQQQQCADNPTTSVSLPLLINQDPALWAAAVSTLGKLRHGCSLCLLYQDEHHCANNHAFDSCHCWPQLAKLGDGDTQRERINGTLAGKLRKAVKWAPNVACWSCFVPMNTCAMDPAAKSFGCSRRYRDMVLPVVAALLRDSQRCKLALQRLGCHSMSAESLQTVLGKEVTYGGQQVHFAFALFVTALQ